ncbi:MAG: outer membrane beta-barrel protein [Bacteroidaceae bacterium]
MKYYICFFLLLFSFRVSAQQGAIKGEISDPILGIGLAEADVCVMNADSTIVGKTKSVYATYTEKRQEQGYAVTIVRNDINNPAPFSISIDEGMYIIKVKKRGYDSFFKNITVKFSTREKIFDIGDIWLTRESVQLGEAKVRGTLLKMVFKGDTIVYNASAFQTAEGDMLGNLIEKLPGAEIKDGRISVNGRFVESLLINGKDFFNGNVEQALRSLPAFTVRNIKTYDKAGEMSETTGYDMHDKYYVMDVQLKRQYKKTWIGSLDVLGGTHDRYNLLGSLMRIDDRLSFCFVGEANNINRKVDAYEGARQGWMASGDGIHYSRAAFGTFRYEPSSKLKFGATASVRNLRDYTGENESSETFLDNGNTFGCSETTGKNIATQVRADANVTLRPKRGFYLRGIYKIQYETGHSNSLMRSASYLSRPDSLFGTNVLDSTFSLSANSEVLRRLVLSRLQQESLQRGNFISHKFNASSQKAFGTNLLSFDGEVYYYQSAYKTFNIYNLNYLHSSLSDDYRHRFYDKTSNKLNYSADLSYIYKYSHNDSVNGQLKSYYTFRQKYYHDENPLFRLDWSSEDNPLIDALPSTCEELMETLDFTNSSYAWQHDTQHEVGLQLLHEFRMPNHSWCLFSATLPYSLRFNRINYIRNKTKQYVSNVSRDINPEISVRWRPVADDRNGSITTLQLWYISKGQPSDLYYLINIEDTSDPLNIYLGNPELKDARSHEVRFALTHNSPKRSSSFYSNLLYSATTNAIAMRRSYDMNTGVSTTTPVNIDGNWTAEWSNDYVRPLGKKQMWTMTLGSNWNFLHSKDLNSWSGSEQTEQSTVCTSTATIKLKMLFRPNKKWSIKGSITPTWNHISGSSLQFTTIDALHMDYTFDSYAKLPFGMEFNNTLTISSRYGYADENLCNTRLLWNASLARAFKYGLNVELKAYDLLHENHRVLSTINAQGRVERYYRMLPAYFMLGLSWNFNKLISKK